MNTQIDAIFLDVGNTLRIVVEDAVFQAQARQQLHALVGARDDIETFFESLETQWKKYRKTSFEQLREASEFELWTRHMLPDYPVEVIGPQAGRLTRLWRDCDGRRVPRHDVKDTVRELIRRGYTLGIIANTITETEIPDWLEADGLTDAFKAVVLSSKVAFRKPGPEIYFEACRRIGIPPRRCAYVGDNPIRDVEGTRLAGFGMAIVFLLDGKEVTVSEAQKADRYIRQCSDLLAIFPPRTSPPAEAEK